jgi:hypothetical protein
VTEQPISGATSSAGETLRGLVMLVCLVALPIAALRGAKWSDVKNAVPETVKRLLNCRWDSNTALAKESEAPRWPASGRGDSRTARTLADPGEGESSPERHVTPGDRPSNSAAPGKGLPGAGPKSASPAGLAVGANTEPDESLFAPRSASSGRPDLQDPGRPSRQKMEMASLDRASLVPVSRRDSDVTMPRSLRPFPTRISEVDTADRSGPSAPVTDRFTYLLGRLRELGAVYYLLETWGSEGQRFRFRCMMAIGGNPGYTRHFEATDPEPMQAIARVLSEVEAWRAAP